MEPERNDRRRAADGSKRDCVFPFPSATSAREAVAERALVAAGDICATHFILNLCGNRTGIVFSSGKLMS